MSNVHSNANGESLVEDEFDLGEAFEDESKEEDNEGDSSEEDSSAEEEE